MVSLRLGRRHVSIRWSPVMRPLCISLMLSLSGCGGGGSTTEGGAPSPSGCSPINDSYAKAVLADKPAVYYRLDDTAGPKVCDASPNHNHGTYATSGVTYGKPGALHGTSDAAIAANGGAQVALSNADSGIAGSTDFTLEGWFQTTTLQDQMVVAIGQLGRQNMAGIGPWANHVTPTFAVIPGTADYICFDTYYGSFTFDAMGVAANVFDGHWHYVAASYSSGSGAVTVYLDNHPLGSQAVMDRPLASPVRIGFWVDTLFNKPFSGGLDEIAVYPSALSAEQIARHYNAAAA